MRLTRSTLFPYTTLFRSEEIDFNILKCNQSYWRKVLVILFIYSTPYFRKWQLFNHHLPPMQQLLFQLLAPVPDKRLRRSEEHTSELQSLTNLVCRLLLEK